MLALTLAPAELWKHPTNDGVYKGFDPKLVYTRPGADGSVAVTPDSLDLVAGPDSEASANLATTLMPNLDASVDVVILANPAGTQPMRIGAWSPWSESGHVVVFGPGPENLITAVTISSGGQGPTLAEGKVVASKVLGHYQLGTTYTVAIVADRSGGTISSSVSGGSIVGAEASMVRRQSPILFRNVQLSIDASAVGNQGSTHATLTHFVVTVPHQRWWASIIADPRAQAIQVALAIAGLVLLGLAIFGRFRGGSASLFALKFRSIAKVPWLLVGGKMWLLIGILGAVAVYLVGNAWLFHFGGHPFDMAYEDLYAYVARTYAPTELYTFLNTKSLPGIWGGTPYLETSFPYGPVFAYVFAGIGWLNSVLFAGGGVFTPDSRSVEYLIKAVNVLFGLADAALIYGILRLVGATKRWSLIAAALFLFNPAVWFSMSIWGQTHVISLFFALLAVWFAEKHLPVWAWLALTAALLTRPQMIVFGLVLGLVFIRKFSWRENLTALSWTGIVTFLALLPLTMATSPSLPVDVMLNNFRIQEGGGNATALSPVSNGGLSIWPLVTYLAHGASGISRTFAANSDFVVGHLTYHRLSLILTLGAMLLVGIWLLLRRRSGFEVGAYLPIVALGITSFLMLITGVVATHFLLALPFLLLCRPWMNTIAYLYVIAIWTLTTLVPMYGEMATVLNPVNYPLLAPGTNAVSEAFVRLYSWDRFITVGIVANICAVIWLAALTLRPTKSPNVSIALPR